MKITVREGNIGLVPSDALITTVNSAGLWFGAIDRLIHQYAGSGPHTILSGNLRHMRESSAISVPAEGSAFKNVVFVIDDLHEDLWVPIYNALDVADFHRHKVVTIPTVRFSVMLGIKEKTIEQYLTQFTKGIIEWTTDNGDPSIEEIKIVVYKDQNMLRNLTTIFV